MKVIIELNEYVLMQSHDHDDSKIEIHIVNRDEDGDINTGMVGKVNIEDIKLALRKLTAK